MHMCDSLWSTELSCLCGQVLGDRSLVFVNFLLLLDVPQVVFACLQGDPTVGLSHMCFCLQVLSRTPARAGV